MATVAKLMSQVMRNKAKVTDPVSSVVYKQFKQASGALSLTPSCHCYDVL